MVGFVKLKFYHRLISNQLYFLVKINTSFEGFVSGSASAYRAFWTARGEDWDTYPLKIRGEKYHYLAEKVFGSCGTDEDDEDYEMQRAFNEEKRQEIAARASGEDGNEEGDEEHGAEGEIGDNGGEGSSKEVT